MKKRYQPAHKSRAMKEAFNAAALGTSKDTVHRAGVSLETPERQVVDSPQKPVRERCTVEGHQHKRRPCEWRFVHALDQQAAQRRDETRQIHEQYLKANGDAHRLELAHDAWTRKRERGPKK